MKASDVEEICQSARVEPAYYKISGELHEALCLLQEGSVWKVFLSERGGRYEEREFDTEDGACVYFLKRLFTLWRPR